MTFEELVAENKQLRIENAARHKQLAQLEKALVERNARVEEVDRANITGAVLQGKTKSEPQAART